MWLCPSEDRHLLYAFPMQKNLSNAHTGRKHRIDKSTVSSGKNIGFAICISRSSKLRLCLNTGNFNTILPVSLWNLHYLMNVDQTRVDSRFQYEFDQYYVENYEKWESDGNLHLIEFFLLSPIVTLTYNWSWNTIIDICKGLKSLVSIRAMNSSISFFHYHPTFPSISKSINYTFDLMCVIKGSNEVKIITESRRDAYCVFLDLIIYVIKAC